MSQNDAVSEAGTFTSRRSARSLGEWSNVSRGQTLRVYVQLHNGERLIIPIQENARIQDLHAAALRRAASVGFDATLADTVMRTSGTNPATLFAEDSVVDFIDMTAENTFILDFRVQTRSTTVVNETANQPSTSSAPIVSSLTRLFGSNQVFVRWITTADAATAVNLSAIPYDPVPFWKDTTLDAFYNEAIARLANNIPTKCTNPTGLNIWVKECQLVAKGNPTTFRNLELKGSRDRPLDIFVELVGPESRSSLAQLSETVNPEQAWSFRSSSKGICTFVTSLSILLEEIYRGNLQLENVVDFLVRLTNFPPAVMAFKKIHDTGLEQTYTVDVGALLLLAETFSHICESMVPDWICGTPDTKLEGSRQVLGWINTCCSAVNSELTVPQYLKRVQFLQHNAQSSPSGTPSPPAALFGHTATLKLPMGGESPITTINGGSSLGPTREVIISLEAPKPGLATLLGQGLALSSTLFDRWNYYFDCDIPWQQFLLIPRIHRPEFADFDNLLLEANGSDAFRVVDPMNLGSCLSADLPIITLSPKGYLSTYDQIDVDCGEREFYLWNLLEKKTVLRMTDPGQYISQQLDPIITERKKGGLWEVDAWPEWSAHATHGDPDESIIVCIDRSGSMRHEMADNWNPSHTSSADPTNPTDQTAKSTRMMEVKEFFKHFSTRLSSYNIRIHTGIVVFNRHVEIIQPLNDNQLNFREKLDSIQGTGGTSIFDALSTAKEMLAVQKRAYPNTKCRIVLLTDGKDNKSRTTPALVATDLFNNQIVLDAIVIGTNHTADLFKICRHTGGYAFKPSTQEVFFQTFLLETMVDIRTRPDILTCPFTDWTTFIPKTPDMRTSFDFPPCRPHPNQADYFVALADANKFQHQKFRKLFTPPASLSSAVSTTSTVSETSILMNEINAMIRNPHPDIDVFVSSSNMRFWKVVIQGPQGSPYQNGAFLLFIDIVPEFPRLPPAVRFITPMLHPNISKHGRICHPIFDREWNTNIHIYQVLQQIYGILMSLEARDAIDLISTLKFYTDREAGERLVRDYVSRFASRSRQRLRADIVGDDVSTIASNSSTITTDSTLTTDSAASGSTISASLPRTPNKSALFMPVPPKKVSQSSLASSNIRDHLANQRRAPVTARPPPLIVGLESTSTLNPSTQSLPLSTANVQGLGGASNSTTNFAQNISDNGTHGQRRISRRASFFARLRESVKSERSDKSG